MGNSKTNYITLAFQICEHELKNLVAKILISDWHSITINTLPREKVMGLLEMFSTEM